MSEPTKRIEELRNEWKRQLNGNASGTFHGMAELASESLRLASSLAAELDAIRGAGDEELNWCREELADTDAELRLIQDLNENHDIAITRGRERDAALQRVAELEAELKEKQDILDQIDWTSQIGGC